ncbi:MAG TPA: ABC transporter substrate-binding protein [Dehalococcoidia bacterium]|nr:ABC transporter substrate-binding protein [Dehalococcoidia bacterium]
MDRQRLFGRMSRRQFLHRAGVAGAAMAGLGLARTAGAAPAARGIPTVLRGASAVELSYFYPIGVAGPLSKIMQGMVDAFNAAHPDIRVKASFTGSYVDTTTKVVTQVQANNPPDVAVMLATDLQSLIDLNAIIPVGDLKPSGDETFDPKDYYPAFFQDTQLDGKTWSVPFQRSTPVLYYNKDAMQKADLDPTKPPQTWDDLVSDSKKIMSAKAAKWGVEIPTSGTAYWLFQSLAIEAGQDLNGADRTHVNFDTPAATEALTWLVDLSTKYGVMPKGVLDWSAAPTDFSSGNTAFLYHSTGSLAAILQQAKFQVGTAFLPKDKQYGVNTGGGNIYIFKKIPVAHQQAAWTFALWMTSPDQAAKWAIQTGYVPVRISATDTSDWKAYIAKTPQAETAIDQLKYAHAELTAHQSSQIQRFMSDAVQAAVAGQKSPAAALKQAQQQADAILKQYR